MKTIIIILVFNLALSTNALSAPVGSGFNYQGELSDGGNPANGNYDVLFKAFTLDTGGTEYGVVPAFSPVAVTNGLFSIDNVDFGDALYDGTEYWIEVSVRQTGTDTYFALSPRQRLNATPYAVQADFLAANGANSGDYLRFDGNNWVGNALNIEPSPWATIGSKISYDTGYVGIGVNPLATLHVKGSTANPVVIDGASNTYMIISENGLGRGYIGSYQTQANTNDEDFEIGTTRSSPGSMHIVTGNNNPRITVTADGKVGINNLTPQADLHVSGGTRIGPFTTQSNAKLDINSTEAGSTSDPLRVRKNGSIKFYVDSNGGASVGSWNTPPANGLRVLGDTTITGNISQALNSNGIVKYMVIADCGSLTPQIIKSNSTVSNSPLMILPAATNEIGFCSIEFPTDVAQRYFQVTTTNHTTATSCFSYYFIGLNDVLGCYVTALNDSDVGRVADIMIMVY